MDILLLVVFIVACLLICLVVRSRLVCLGFVLFSVCCFLVACHAVWVFAGVVLQFLVWVCSLLCYVVGC